MKYLAAALLLFGAALIASVPAARAANAGQTNAASHAVKERCFDRSNSRRYHQQYCSGL